MQCNEFLSLFYAFSVTYQSMRSKEIIQNVSLLGKHRHRMTHPSRFDSICQCSLKLQSCRVQVDFFIPNSKTFKAFCT